MIESFYKQAMSRYQLLSVKDQRLLAVLGVFLFVLGIYSLVLLPIQNKVALTKTSMERNKDMLLLMKTNEARVATLQRMGAVQVGIGGKSLLSVVNETAALRNLPLKRVEPKGEESIRVWVEDVSFNEFLSWLHTLDAQFKVRVDNLTVESQSEAGVVNAQLVLSVGVL
jgi:general secretion pathway protein M